MFKNQGLPRSWCLKIYLKVFKKQINLFKNKIIHFKNLRSILKNLKKNLKKSLKTALKSLKTAQNHAKTAYFGAFHPVFRLLCVILGPLLRQQVGALRLQVGAPRPVCSNPWSKFLVILFEF